MLISEKLILVDLHKAGLTKLQKLMVDIVGGDTFGKHATYARELVELNKPVVAYVCSPLAWYLSLWRMGCAGKGDLWKRLTDPKKWSLMYARRAARAKSGEPEPEKQAVPEGWNEEHAAKAWYGDAESPEAFREWLRAVLSTRALRRMVSQAYHVSPINKLGGLMTHEFLLAFMSEAENIELAIDTLPALAAAYEQRAITRHFIRAEFMAEDFEKVASALGLTLTDAQRQAAQVAGADRAVVSAEELARFYDPESRQLVKRRERFVNELLGYAKPNAGGAEGGDAAAAGKAGKNAGKNAGKKAGKKLGQKAGNKAGEGAAGKPGKNAAKGDKPKLDAAAKAAKQQRKAEKMAAAAGTAVPVVAGEGAAAAPEAAGTSAAPAPKAPAARKKRAAPGTAPDAADAADGAKKAARKADRAKAPAKAAAKKARKAVAGKAGKAAEAPDAGAEAPVGAEAPGTPEEPGTPNQG